MTMTLGNGRTETRVIDNRYFPEAITVFGDLLDWSYLWRRGLSFTFRRTALSISSTTAPSRAGWCSILPVAPWRC
jgi:hypothetical protein